MADLSYHADGQDKPAEWWLYECGKCGGRTFLGPEGGKLDCSCGAGADSVTFTPLYAGATHPMSVLLGAVSD